MLEKMRILQAYSSNQVYFSYSSVHHQIPCTLNLLIIITRTYPIRKFLVERIHIETLHFTLTHHIHCLYERVKLSPRHVRNIQPLVLAAIFRKELSPSRIDSGEVAYVIRPRVEPVVEVL